MEPEIEQLLADLNAHQERVFAQQRALEATEFTVSVADGDVLVRLLGTGQLAEVRIDPPAMRRYDAEELGTLIVEAVNSGTARVLQAGRERFAPLLSGEQD